MRRGGKRRFGVSIPEDTACRLEELAEALGVDRSTLVAEAVDAYLHEKSHGSEPHLCEGVLVVFHPSDATAEIAGVFEEYTDMVVTRNHIHAGSMCVEIAYVKGDTEMILSLEKDLRRAGAEACKYVARPHTRVVR